MTLKQRFKELWDQGIKQNEIADTLNKEGLLTPSRHKQWTGSGVSLQAKKWKFKRRYKSTRRTKAEAPRESRKSMSSSDKLAMIDLFIECNNNKTKDLKYIQSIISL